MCSVCRGGRHCLAPYLLCCLKFLLGLAGVHPQCRDEGEGAGIACIYLCQVALRRAQCCCHSNQGHVCSGPQHCNFSGQRLNEAGCEKGLGQGGVRQGLGSGQGSHDIWGGGGGGGEMRNRREGE